MRNLRISLFTLAALVTSTATALASDSIFGNIRQGSLLTGAAVAYTSVSQPNVPTFSVFTLQAPAQYFLVDYFALGIGASYTHNSSGGGSNSGNVGPAATWYLWNSGRVAAYLGAEGDYVSYGSGFDGYDAFGRVGFTYFATPSVGLGPEFSWFHQFQNNSTGVTKFDQITIGARFSVFLDLN